MTEIKFKPFDEIDEECKMTIASFRQGVKYHCYTDYDGFGYYATENEISNVYVDCNAVLKGNYPNWVTHVCWFNK